MSDITITIPRSTAKAKVEVASDYYFDELPQDSSQTKTFSKDPENKKRLAHLAKRHRFERSQKVIFTEKFVISKSNQPVQISLKNIVEPSLSLADARIEIQAAYDKGFSDGQESSNIAYQNQFLEYQEWISRFDEIIRSIQNKLKEQIKLLEKSALPVASMMASHIIGQEISLNENIIIEQIRKAIKHAADDNIFKITLNPDDFLILNEVKNKLAGGKSEFENIEISTDKNILRGGCIVNTSAGIIDATIESRLQKLTDILSEEI